MMSEVLYLLSEIRAQAMVHFRRTPSEVVIRNGDATEEAEVAANPITVPTNKYMELSIFFERFFNSNLSTKAYRTATDMIKKSNGDITMRSTYHLFKPAKEKVKTYQIKNTEYGTAVTEAVNNTSLSSNLARDDDQKIIMKDDLKVPEFLFGASLPIDTMMNLILHRIRQIVSQIPGATVSDALGTSILLGCADAAVMDSLSKANQHVTSFSVVPTSRF